MISSEQLIQLGFVVHKVPEGYVGSYKQLDINSHAIYIIEDGGQFVEVFGYESSCEFDYDKMKDLVKRIDKLCTDSQEFGAELCRMDYEQW